MQDILPIVDSWLEKNHAVALATVVETWGSAPRLPGAHMAIKADMAMAGSVSGGCVENAVIEAGLQVLRDSRPQLLHFTVSDDSALDVGLACGGNISIFIQLLDLQWWQAVTYYLRLNQPVTLLTILDGPVSGQQMVIGADGRIAYYSPHMQPDTQQQLCALAQTPQPTGQTLMHDTPVMFQQIHAEPHLVIVGGVHIAIPLVQFASVLGFRVSLIDPRQAFASTDRFPNVHLLNAYPDKVLPQLGLDHNTYLAVLSHDPKIDDKALLVALPSPVAYVGVLSSRRTHQQRIQRLLAEGLTLPQLERIHTPIGLNINARTPEEIALCIMAEIVAVRNANLRR